MTDTIIISLVAFVASLIAVMTPLIKVLIKVNKNLTTLNVTLENLQHENEKEHGILEKRVSDHGDEIDELKVKAENHEVRIGNLENR